MAHDLHPDYLTSKFSREQEEIPTLAVQHHHAHIVSCLAENGVKGPVIGLTLDGTGFGSDGQVWGGEVLFADLYSFKRAAHLDYVSLPGGDASVKSPWRMALSYLHKAYGDELFELPIRFVRGLKREDAKIVLQMMTKRVNTPLTSSCGRLFDAISSLIGLRQKMAYEGQAAMELEMCQNLSEKGKYPWAIKEKKGHLILLTSDIIRSAVEDIKIGMSRGIISRRFHNTLIDMLTGTCMKLREASGIDHVAMSGGSFQNVTLLNGLSHALTSKGFKVFTQKVVPSNDGGLSLGQAVCAGLRYMGAKGEFDNEGHSWRNALDEGSPENK
jgi:hydrogenase maturation protein HypF